jgi:transposase
MNRRIGRRLADELDYVVGVDTHRDAHALVAVAAPAGAVVARQPVRANAGSYREALRFAERYAPGGPAWAIEGTGSYGAGLARLLADRGETVLELSCTPRAERPWSAQTQSSCKRPIRPRLGSPRRRTDNSE